MDYHALFNRWCDRVTDPDLYAELVALAEQHDETMIEDAFYRSLEFGTAGLRGILGAGTNRMNIYTVGQATQGIANYITAHEAQGAMPTAVVCFDSRINSDLFARRAACVLAARGVKTYLFPRLEPTPVLSFAVRYLHCDIGINVTASHNPSQYNGYKVYGPDGCQIASQMADDITACIAEVDIFDDVFALPFEDAHAQGLIEFVSEDVIEAYLDAVYEQRMPQRDSDPLRVVYTPLHGTGLECVSKILHRIGIDDLHVVEEQASPDGTFPTCPYPNPENRDALELGIALCETLHPDVLLGTDPDADRVGIAVQDEGGYRLLSGNEVGVLLLDYVCRLRSEHDIMPENPVAVTTIVSTGLVDPIARHYGVEVRRVLTGFKYIGSVIAELEEAHQEDRFIFGFEESYGYLAGTHARDKDAVVTSMLISQMARYYRAQGKTLYQAMQDLYQQYGYYCNATLSFTFEGIDGQKKMSDLMHQFREQPLASIAGLTVCKVLDYACGVNGLPCADVIEFDLEGAQKVIVRPSGTEPKVKVYVFAVASDEEIANKVKSDLCKEMTQCMK